jgi:hypothetical protein
MVFGADDRLIRVCDTLSWETEKVLSGHDGVVWCIAVCPSLPIVCSGAADRTIRVWDSNTWMLQGVIDQHTGVVRSLGFHPRDHNMLISGASDRTCRMFKVKTLEPCGLLQGPFGGVRFASFVQPDTIVCGCGDGVFGLWREDPDEDPQLATESKESKAKRDIADWPQLKKQVALDAPWKRMKNGASSVSAKTEELERRERRVGERETPSSASKNQVAFAQEMPTPTIYHDPSLVMSPSSRMRRVSSEPMINSSQVVANAVLRSGPQAELSAGFVRKLRQRINIAAETGIGTAGRDRRLPTLAGPIQGPLHRALATPMSSAGRMENNNPSSTV